MERSITFLEGEFYHVYNRGINKEKIFFDENDRKHFQKLLYTRNTSKRIDTSRVKGLPLHKIDRNETLVDIVAYVLMPNHYHLIVREKTPAGISTFMGKLGTAYSMSINTKYKRTGALMCHPYRSKHINTDRYLRWLMLYVHNNPKKLSGENNQTNFLKQYQYSSYIDYFGAKRDERLILNPKTLPFPEQEIDSDVN
mgnify:FL=1